MNCLCSNTVNRYVHAVQRAMSVNYSTARLTELCGEVTEGLVGVTGCLGEASALASPLLPSGRAAGRGEAEPRGVFVCVCVCVCVCACVYA